MVSKIVFENEVVLYWDKQYALPDGVEYRALLSGQTVGKTVKTHFAFKNLQEDTEYSFCIQRLDEHGGVAETLYQAVIRTSTAKRRIDVTKPPYNAVGDGKTLNTKALQRAFDDCGANDCVYLPSGIFLTGALNVHSYSELYVEKGATLKGTENPKDYLPKIKSRYEGIERTCYRSLLNVGQIDHEAGYTSRNVIVRGGGVIFGGGAALSRAIIDAEKDRLAKGADDNQEYLQTGESVKTVCGRARGRLISVNNCENVIIANVTMGYAASWNVHFVYSKNVITYGCKILSEEWTSDDGVWKMQEVHNGDGWDPDSSEDCTIFNTFFCTRDDAVAIKSGKGFEGNVINRPAKNIRIFDCVGNMRGLAIGSELSGGISDVQIWDCSFYGKIGFTIKTTRQRGAYVKNVTIRNCDFAYVKIDSNYNCNNDVEGEAVTELTKVENVAFENVKIKGEYPYLDKSEEYYYTLYLCGFDEEDAYFSGFTFKNIQIGGRSDDGMQTVKIKNVKNISIENMSYFKYEESL